MRFVAVLLLFFALSDLATRAEETDNSPNAAPFGLKWGVSAADVKALGIKLSDFNDKKMFGISYRATELTKIVPDAAFVALSFGFQDKLWRIVVIGQNVENDPYGNGVKARYKELAAALSEKYGRGKPNEYQDSEMWKNADEFLMGINVGRSWYYTDFDTPNVFVQLGIQAEGGSTAHWRLIYEWKSLRALFEIDQKAKEKDAL
ncbi:MAG: hypothetical protein ACLPN5_09070 [Roseiarcus sp.]